MAVLLEQGLEEEGHAVDTALDGPDAVWMATENPYGAIVLDVMLPGFDGYEVARRLRAAGQWAPILFLTARTAVADRVAGLDAGADDYLVKPFSFEELSARLRPSSAEGNRSARSRSRSATCVSTPRFVEPGETAPSSSSRPRSSLSWTCSCAIPASC
jgi:DNA-binding response OmpR family regulator